MSSLASAQPTTVPAHVRVLILSLAPYRFATRTRKAAVAYRETMNVRFLGFQGVGRTGKWDRAGTSEVDSMTVTHVPVRPPSSKRGRSHQASNLARSYIPAFIRLVYAALRTPAAVVHVTGAPLALVGLLHKKRFGSIFLLDINERPASVSAAGSLFAVFSRFEPAILRLCASRADVTTVVTPGHAAILESEYAFTNVITLRNAPLRSWRAPFRPAPPVDTGGIQVVTVGTIFEGRAFESLVHAVSLTRATGTRLRLSVYGGGRKTYIDELRSLCESLGVADCVTFEGPLDSSHVSEAYLDGQVGLALYDPVDAGNDSLSNKLLECVSTGRPVLAGNLTENQRFVTEHGVGWLTPVTAEGISDSFIQIAEEYASLVPLALACRRLGDEQLTWEMDFAKVVDAVGLLLKRPAVPR